MRTILASIFTLEVFTALLFTTVTVNSTTTANSTIHRTSVNTSSSKVDAKNPNIFSIAIRWMLRLRGYITNPTVEYESYDGWFNNRALPHLGATSSPVIRLLGTGYALKQPSDTTRPTSSLVGKTLEYILYQKSVTSGRNILFLYFGKLVMEEIINMKKPECPVEYFGILEPDDSSENEENDTYNKKRIQYSRSLCKENSDISPSNPRHRLNQVTPWLDGEVIYGHSKSQSCMLRTFEGGKLSDTNEYQQTRDLWTIEDPIVSKLKFLWLKLHNGLAEIFQNVNKNWTDEQLFNEARKWVIGIYQHLIINIWLPVWLEEELPQYSGYNARLDPSIYDVFEPAAASLKHTFKVFQIHKVSTDCSITGAVQTCNSYDVRGSDLEELLIGMSLQSLENDTQITYEEEEENNQRHDLAIEIQYERDCGFPDYKTALQEQGFNIHFDTFNEMAKLFPKLYQWKPELFDELLPELYGNKTDNIDILVGMLLEISENTNQLFHNAVQNQFQRIRDGDRFWFENLKNGLFTESEVKVIKMLKLYHILQLSMNTPRDIVFNDFHLPSSVLGLDTSCAVKLVKSNCKWKDKEDVCYYIYSDSEDIVDCDVPQPLRSSTGRKVSLALFLLFLGTYILGCIFLLLFLRRRRRNSALEELKRMNAEKRKSLYDNSAVAIEWVGREDPRCVVVNLCAELKNIKVSLLTGETVRHIDLSRIHTLEVLVSTSEERDKLLIRVSRHYDLVLLFENTSYRESFLQDLEKFLGDIGVGRQRLNVTNYHIQRDALTKADRQAQLEKFLRVVFAQAFLIEHDQEELFHVDAIQAKEVINTKLVPFEFAEALSLPQDSIFVTQMFSFVDKQNSGCISLREFLDMIVIFAKGAVDEKSQLLFDTYDIDNSGNLMREDFTALIKSLLFLTNESLTADQVGKMIGPMLRGAGLHDKKFFTLSDLRQLIKDHAEELGYFLLNFDVGKSKPEKLSPSFNQSALARAQDTIIRAYCDENEVKENQTLANQAFPSQASQVKVATGTSSYKKKGLCLLLILLRHFLELYRLQVFWVVFYTLVLIGLFHHSFYTYIVQTDYQNFGKIASYGLAISQGAKTPMMLSFSLVILTMCHYVVIKCRSTFLDHIFPFGSIASSYSYAAFCSFIFSVIHVIGHMIFLYCMSSQPAVNLSRLFPSFYPMEGKLSDFHYWLFHTITGITGVLLILVLLPIYLFTSRFVCYCHPYFFWASRSLYILAYILLNLHGLGRVFENPAFYCFFLLPCILFILNTLVSISKKITEVFVIHAKPLSSDVMLLLIKKPPNFKFMSGQWVRISCPAISHHEYYHFAVSSAPQEETLAIHIRNEGPWTANLLNKFNHTILKHLGYPKLYLDGPYGKGHRSLLFCDVTVLIGGGRGGPLLSSLLKDMLFQRSTEERNFCKKIYFIWITRSQKEFPWMINVIKEIEEKDKTGLIDIHIFITQFYQKSDMHTVMLYVCEQYFQKLSGRNLLTGLRTPTHFGHPDLHLLLASLQVEHPGVGKFGVVTFGSPSLMQNVQQSCDELNKREGALFAHHSEDI
ncbi:dual oxidase 2-like isoform X2 [Limulus polyphemus]|uniref:NAD(P)H oxidase (H2O2-forming) n=1 Tax=Limulus polyphemus TaxID=6850 RepID=A0ABM1SVN9_LIMPO|nr:dual oxidase 2-like isoform X2 [Limulus polyphemus]